MAEQQQANDLHDFLRARLDEDERAAQDALKRTTTSRRMVQGQMVEVATQPPEWRRSAWTPARVLAEVEAKRRVVGRVQNHATLMGRDEMHGDVLRSLALPYADHPDYREEWRP